MKGHATVYDLVGRVARIGGLGAALAVIVAGAFRGVTGWALAVRVATAFVVVTVVLNLLGFVTVRSLLAGVVAGGAAPRKEAGRKESIGPKRA